jgi:large subunit ribosomal protein L47
LRAHVSNWRQLNLKQRKVILGFLNAKRAKDAKKELIKELKVLGQKLAHQEIKERTQAK